MKATYLVEVLDRHLNPLAEYEVGNCRSPQHAISRVKNGSVDADAPQGVSYSAHEIQPTMRLAEGSAR